MSPHPPNLITGKDVISMNTIYSIYKITNIINGKSYIGYTKKKPETRFEEHCRSKDKYKLPKAIAKYGKQNFTVTPIYQSKDLNHIRSMEDYFILEYNSIKEGYNIARGGQGGCIVLYKENPNYDLICEKMSKAQKRNREFLSEKAKRQHKEGTLGNPYLNGVRDETRRKLSDIRKGKKNSEEHVRKQRESLLKKFNTPGYVHPNKNRVRTEEEKKKISENHADVSGENNPMFGKLHSEEAKEKIRKKRLNQPKIKCIYCKKEVDKANYVRWHGEKCKKREIEKC